MLRYMKYSALIALVVFGLNGALHAEGLPRLSLPDRQTRNVQQQTEVSSSAQTPTPSPTLPVNGSGMLFNLSLVLGLMLAAAGALAYFKRKGWVRRTWFSTVGPIEVMHRQAISRGTQILLVRIGERVLVLGQNAQQLRTLDTITEPREIQNLHHELAGRKSTEPEQAFEQQLDVMQHGHEDDVDHENTRQEGSDASARARAVENRARSILKQRYHGTGIILLAMGLWATSVSAQTANINGESISVEPAPAVMTMDEPLPSTTESANIATLRPSLNLDTPQGLSSTLTIVFVLTLVSLAPAAIIMCTSFTRIIVVLALLRQAMGTQTLPPTQVIVGLSLFLSLMIMAPTIREVHREALEPLSNGEITQYQAWEKGRVPVRSFMFAQIERMDNWDTVYMLMNYQRQEPVDPENLTHDDIDTLVLVPAFVLSELKTAFLMGFRLYLPFLIIDMVVSSILISMGMLMLPPVLISLPFKLLLFVIVDGWMLVAGNLLDSFSLPLSVITT